MSKIKVNGIERPMEQERMVFGDFIAGLNRSMADERMVVSSIRINGQELTETEEKRFDRLPIGEIGDIEVETSNPMELAYQTLDTLDQYTDRLIAGIALAAECYKKKNLLSGDAYFVKAIDGLDLFVQTIGGIKLALRLGLHQSVAITEAELVSIMNDMLSAKRQNNYVHLAELLEKDLVANLGEWKAKVFPFFRSWRTA